MGIRIDNSKLIMTIDFHASSDQKSFRLVIRGRITGPRSLRRLQKALEEAGHFERTSIDLSEAASFDESFVRLLEKCKENNPRSFGKLRIVNPRGRVLKALTARGETLGIAIDIG